MKKLLQKFDTWLRRHRHIRCYMIDLFGEYDVLKKIFGSRTFVSKSYTFTTNEYRFVKAYVFIDGTYRLYGTSSLTKNWEELK